MPFLLSITNLASPCTRIGRRRRWSVFLSHPLLLPVSPIYTHFPAHLHTHRTALTMEELTADEDVELWLFRMPLDVSHPPSLPPTTRPPTPLSPVPIPPLHHHHSSTPKPLPRTSSRSTKVQGLEPSSKSSTPKRQKGRMRRRMACQPERQMETATRSS